ncbi:TPA: 6-phosphogluconolactonase [Candidatus Woesearchaeota archaeon]|nr:6-phosphogluconolactonase [Candidatus Woesearchaeota archaeon]
MTVQTITELTENGAYATATARLVDSLGRCLRKQRLCVLGIVGGRSIPHIMDMLLPYAPQLKGLGRIEVFWLDERAGHEKNYPVALPYLEHLHHAGVDIAWHPFMSAHHESMAVEARQALGELSSLRSSAQLDIILLSSGEDGHIASLFPRHAALGDRTSEYILIHDAPKTPKERITASVPLLLTASEAILLFIGEKRHAYELFMKPDTHIADCPARLVQGIPVATVITWLN